MFQPHFETLSPAQRVLWPELAEVPPHFVLYGGTALTLRLGHRESLDFDFFSSTTVIPGELLESLAFLQGAKVLQNTGQTLTVAVNRRGTVKLSFFGGLSLGRVGEPERTSDAVIQTASLLDIAGTKAAVITQRAEAKDYLDLLAILDTGISLCEAMAAARALYGEQYNPMITVKSLTYFGDGDLHKLTPAQRSQLLRVAAVEQFTLPKMERLSNDLAPI